MQELGIDLRIIHLSNTDHILYQGTRLRGINRVHLLEGREIASGQIETLHTVIAVNGQLTLRILGFQLPFTAHATEQNDKKGIINSMH